MKQLLIISIVLITFFSCKKEGDKDCPTGFTGSNCSQQVTPTNILIKSISVTSFPATDANGAGWDLTNGPDIYITISQNGNVLYENSANFSQNGAPNVTFNTNFVLPDVDGIYSVSVYDYDDFDSDDFMGGIISPIYTSLNGFPSNVVLSCSGCAVSLSLSVNYTH